jgi:hypothetical protein
MPRKVFTAGEVLAAADVNSFMMDQTIMTFAGTAARGSAIVTATEGMYAHLNDTDALTYYNGSAWVNRIPASTSAILQVVSATTSTQVDSTSLSYVTTGLTATITPSSTSSKIAIFVATGGRNANATSESVYTIFRGTVAGTNLAPGNFGIGSLYNPSGQTQGIVSSHIIDSPNTTSAQTYTLGMKLTVSGGGVRAQNESSLGSIILMEVAG